MITDNCTTTLFDLAKKIFAGYEGVVSVEEKKVKIVSKNMLGDKKVECECSIGLLDGEKFPYSVDAVEKTYSIIGGCGCPCKNLKEVEDIATKTLKRYCFVEKEQQLSLFDFMKEEKKMRFKLMLKRKHHLIMSEDYETDEKICDFEAKDLEEAKEIAMRILVKGHYPRGKVDTGKDNYIELKYRVEEIK